MPTQNGGGLGGAYVGQAYVGGQPYLADSGSAITLTAAAGAFSLTGNFSGLTVARQLTAAAGAFTLSGQAATLVRARSLTAAVGAFTLTGRDAELIYDGPVALSLTAAAGSFTLTGNSATLTAPTVPLELTDLGGITFWRPPIERYELTVQATLVAAPAEHTGRAVVVPPIRGRGGLTVEAPTHQGHARIPRSIRSWGHSIAEPPTLAGRGRRTAGRTERELLELLLR